VEIAMVRRELLVELAGEPADEARAALNTATSTSAMAMIGPEDFAHRA
jgi:hypothetical protein